MYSHPLTAALALVAALSAAQPASATLIYQYSFDGGGSGSTVNDVSGFGTAANGTTQENNPAVLTDVRATTAPVSPAGGVYGDFNTARTRMDFSSAKWNDDANGVAGGSNAFTFAVLVRDFSSGASGGGTTDRAIFNDTSGSELGLNYVGDPASNSVTLNLEINNNGGVNASAPADLSNATTGDSNGWVLLALTYSSASDAGKIYVARNYDAGTGLWTDVTQVGSDIAIVSSSIANESGTLQLGGSSSRAPRTNFDDVRIYSEVLDASELAALHIPEPASLALLGLGGVCLLTGRRRAA